MNYISKKNQHFKFQHIVICLLLNIFIFGCSVENSKKNDLSNILELEEADSTNHVFPFVDLKNVKVVKDSCSYIFILEFANLPDSISFHNPNIERGYEEYSLSIQFKNKFNYPSADDILKVECIYNNFNKYYPIGRKRALFSDFLNNHCRGSIHIQKQTDSLEYYLIPIDQDPIISIHNNKIKIRSLKENLDSIEARYFWGKWNVRVFFNYPENLEQNLYDSDYLSNDSSFKQIPRGR